MSTIDYERIWGADNTSKECISKDEHTSFAASIDLQTKVEPKTYSMAVCNVNQFSDNNSQNRTVAISIYILVLQKTKYKSYLEFNSSNLHPYRLIRWYHIKLPISGTTIAMAQNKYFVTTAPKHQNIVDTNHICNSRYQET